MSRTSIFTSQQKLQQLRGNHTPIACKISCRPARAPSGVLHLAPSIIIYLTVPYMESTIASHLSTYLVVWRWKLFLLTWTSALQRVAQIQMCSWLIVRRRLAGDVKFLHQIWFVTRYVWMSNYFLNCYKMFIYYLAFI